MAGDESRASQVAYRGVDGTRARTHAWFRDRGVTRGARARVERGGRARTAMAPTAAAVVERAAGRLAASTSFTRPTPHAAPTVESDIHHVRVADVHVLVVDDERICRTVTSLLLRNCGYRVTTASSGEEALELLRRGIEFHLLLTDVMMPGIDGPALLQIVRNDERLRDMPVIMMSANEHSETVFRCIQYGAEDYLLKPVSKKAVKHMWQHVWRKSQLLAARAVPRFENGEEVLEDEDEDRGEMVHGVPAVPEHPSASNEGENVVVVTMNEEASTPGIGPVTGALVGEGELLRAKATSRACPYAARRAAALINDAMASPNSSHDAMDTDVDGMMKPLSMENSMGDLQHFAVPDTFSKPLPEALAGFSKHPRRLRDWLNDTDAMKLVSREDRAHVAAQVASCFDSTTIKSSFSHRADASRLEITPQGAISSPLGDPLEEDALKEDSFSACSPSEFLALIALEVLFPKVHAALLKERDPRSSLAKVKSLSGFASEMKAKARRPEADVVVRLLGNAPISAIIASKEFQAVAGDERAHAVDTERRIFALKRLETILETLRTARDAQKQELSHSRSILDELVTEVGANTNDSDVPAKKRAKRDEDADYSHAAGVKTGSIACYDDKSLKLVDLSAVVYSGFRSAKSLEASVFVDLERSLFVKCARAMAADGANQASKSDSDGAWVKRLRADGASVQQALEKFEDELCLVTRSISLKRCASIGGDFADFAANNAMVCCASWDRDGELFATAGTSKSICVYETSAVVRLGARVHCPALEFKAQSKVSALCCNPYVKQSLASGDYQGVVQLWDVAKEVSTWENTTHRRRVWSIDFSDVDPTKLASGSDDGTVRVFSTTTKESVCVLNNRANVCSVKFHPTSAHLLAIGSADHKVHCYDLRQPNAPLATLQGHRKAVSYVRWVGNEIVSASTDNTLKLWDITRRDPRKACVRTYMGHTNEKNFVGLSANANGYIACGSEDNVVHVYAKHSSAPVACYGFNAEGPIAQNRRDKGGFISSVAWSPDNKHLIAANSRGHLKILELCKM